MTVVVRTEAPPARIECRQPSGVQVWCTWPRAGCGVFGSGWVGTPDQATSRWDELVAESVNNYGVLGKQEMRDEDKQRRRELLWSWSSDEWCARDAAAAARLVTARAALRRPDHPSALCAMAGTGPSGICSWQVSATCSEPGAFMGVSGVAAGPPACQSE
jgi:hypothetical protein